MQTGALAVPPGLSAACWVLLGVALVCALVVTVDVVRHPPQMRVMAVVWPLTMLFGSVVWLVFYLRRGRTTSPGHGRFAGTAIDTSHCGAGCALGDLVGEFGLVVFPGLGALVGLGWLYRDGIYAGWAIDFVIAFVVGIAFQYFAIAPMRGLSLGAGLRAAVKADTLSITSWQVGMYGLMAVLQFAVLAPVFGAPASVFTPEFWFVMQLAMLAGFATAYPVNALLIRAGVKERM